MGRGVLADCMEKKSLEPKEGKRKGCCLRQEEGLGEGESARGMRRVGAEGGQRRTLRTCPKES